jgi:hypothetical protein
MLALKTVVSSVLRRFQLNTYLKMEDIQIKGEISVHIKGGYFVTLKDRKTNN